MHLCYESKTRLSAVLNVQQYPSHYHLFYLLTVHYVLSAADTNTHKPRPFLRLLPQMISDLKEAVTRKDQFMSLMSHELRTPLNGIIQLGDALCRGAGERGCKIKSFLHC